MKKIQLTQGLFAVVDDEKFEYLNQFKWCANKGTKNKTHYAVRGIRFNGEYTMEYMHRVVAGVEDGQVVDHINHDTLDNRKENLRVGTHVQNLLNSVKRENTSSKYKGVSYFKKNGKWSANYRGKNIGYFSIEKDAAQAYNAMAFKDSADWPVLNEIEGLTKEQSIVMPESYHPYIRKNRYHGVRKRSENSFEAYIAFQKKRWVIGYYPTEELAVQAYNNECDKLGVSKKKNIVLLSNVA